MSIKHMLNSEIVKMRISPFYILETQQYFNDVQFHLNNLARAYGLEKRPDLDYSANPSDTSPINGIYTNRMLDLSQEEETAFTFEHCEFSGCAFNINPTQEVRFIDCIFKTYPGHKQEYANVFDGAGRYQFTNIEHGMLIFQGRTQDSAKLNLHFENCSDLSLYLFDCHRVQLHLNYCSFRRILVKHGSIVVWNNDSRLMSFLLLPSSDRARTSKATELYQTTNSMISERLLEKGNADYFPINLMRLLSKIAKYQEERYHYNEDLKFKGDYPDTIPPKPDVNGFVLKAFDFFSYPFSLLMRCAGVILFFAVLYLFVGLRDIQTKAVISLFDGPITLGTFLRQFSVALYFSISSFTTAGYGDYVLRQGFELISALEAVLGVILSGAIITSIFNRYHH